MVSERQYQVLHKIATTLKDKPFHWAVTGSLGMVLHGIPLEIHDIDIQTDKDGAFQFEKIFREYQISPVHFRESDRLRSYFGKFIIMDIPVEIMGDMQKRIPNQQWEAPVDVTEHIEWLEVAGMQIPVLSIEYEYQAYCGMGRLDRAALLKLWLENQKNL